MIIKEIQYEKQNSLMNAFNLVVINLCELDKCDRIFYRWQPC